MNLMSYVSNPDLSSGAFRVMTAILDLDREPGGCTASNATLGDESGGKSPRSVARALRELESLGLIRCHHDTAGNVRRIIVVVN